MSVPIKLFISFSHIIALGIHIQVVYLNLVYLDILRLQLLYISKNYNHRNATKHDSLGPINSWFYASHW